MSEVEQLKKELLERGKINADELVMIIAGNEQIIAEWKDTENNLKVLEMSRAMKVKNPKRFLRIQQMDQRSGAIITNFVVMDYDFIEGGELLVYPMAWSTFGMMDKASQENLLKIMLNMTENKARERAAEAGIISPATSLVRQMK